MNVLASFAAELAVKLLGALLARHDIKEGVRKDFALLAERQAKKAEAYKAAHPVNLEPGDLTGPLRVRKPKARIQRISRKRSEPS